MLNFFKIITWYNIIVNFVVYPAAEFIPSERLSKVTVQQAKKELQLKKDYTSENVKKLLALSKSKLKIKDTDKVIRISRRFEIHVLCFYNKIVIARKFIYIFCTHFS